MAIGSALGFGIPAWAAATSEWLDVYGRIAWVGAGFSGLIVAIILMVAVAYFVPVARHKWYMTNVVRRFYEDHERVNPLEDVFSQKRIRIEDMFPPLTTRIGGKTFIRCEMIGPAVICLDFSQTYGAGGDAVDAVVGPDGVPTHNVLYFDGCVFRDCRFYRVTFVVRQSLYEPFKTANPNIPFVSLVPPEPEQTTLADH